MDDTTSQSLAITAEDLSRSISISDSPPSKTPVKTPEDADLYSIVVANFLPRVTDADQLALLYAAKHDVESWLALSLSQIETTVQQKIREKKLKDDESLDSKIQRADFRSKVFDLIERKSSWVPAMDERTKTFSKPVKKEDAYRFMVRQVIDSCGLSGTKLQPFEIYLRALANGSPQFGPRVNNRSVGYRFVLVEYNRDSLTNSFAPAIHIISLQVGEGQSKPAAAANDKSEVEITFGISKTQGQFNRSLWDGAGHGDKIPENGIRLLRQRLLEFSVENE